MARAWNRRRFLELGTLGAMLAAAPRRAEGAAADAAPDDEQSDDVVRLSGDGVGLNAAQYARLLGRIADARGIAPDSYSIGGVVEELETRFATLLGKERAVFMPSGTLANHLAVRALAGGPSRVIVQEESHLYQDEGDCAQTLSALTLMPLAAGASSFSAADVQRLLEQARAARVVNRVSVISIETPVRRKQGQTFDPAQLDQVIELARREGIKLHLDGARLFLQAAYTGKSVAEYARPFDTVYVSLYKYFNAASGAILAGPRDLLDGMFHVRRMFGGGLSSVWPFAAVALHYLDSFGERYAEAVRRSEELIAALATRNRFKVERVPNGTNLFRLHTRGVDPARLRSDLRAKGIMLPAPQGGSFLIGVNETLNRKPVATLVDAFTA
jgi:threonine aldolase